MIRLAGFIVLLFFAVTDSYSQVADTPEVSPQYIIQQINKIRTSGCRCGRKRMPPVKPIQWNGKLYTTASTYAKYMYKHKRFSHISLSGENVGHRMDNIGYIYQYSGENIGSGQENFDQVLIDWLESKSHCEMIMNKDMIDMGVGRYGKYWVQHFGAPLPENVRVVGSKYIEN